MGVMNPRTGPGSYCAAEPGETIWDAFRRTTSWLIDMDDPGPFQRMALAPGDYHRRIARPTALSETPELLLPNMATERRYIVGAQNQLGALIDALRAICRVVQPTPRTLGVYGHEIRNLLILAATQVEMHWRGILTANARTAKFNSNEFVKLADPLKLRDYRVRFHSCPDIDPVMPFAAWTSAYPTESLRWFAAYQGVKHNREFEFERASLAHAFDAVAACAVLLVAQFGEETLTADLTRYLAVEVPAWPLEQMYIPPQSDTGWMALPHPELG
jgi:hypothetical protein